MLLEEGININVVLLPDGEDPDSYAQSHSTEEFEEYLKRNSVDFIQFKTNLLMNEVGDDPVRRAGLIGDIVKSIAVIPNDILRSEYIKRCSDMLKVSEQLLVSETAKIRIKRAEERQKNLQGANSDNRQPSAPQPEENNIEQSIVEESKNNPLYNKERAIIQFILRNGEKPLLVPEDATNNTPAFTESVISNMHYSITGDGIEFTHPLYKKIFEEAAQQAESPNFIAEKHFLAHPDADISRLTAELCNDRYLLSKFFQEKADEEERNETAILFEQATRLVIGYKLSLVDEMLKETMKKLKEPATMQSAELAQEIMQNYKFLKETQQALNSQLRSYGFGECALNV